MKIIMKPVDMVAWFTRMGLPTPVRFRIEQDGKMTTVKIDQVSVRDEEKLAGNRMLIFRCQSIIAGELRIFELKYEVATCRWYLFKM